MNAEEVLLQLRDIRPPPEPGWWHLSPASMLLLAGGMLGMLLFVYLRNRRRNNRLLELATDELRQIAATANAGVAEREIALALGEWLKRVAVIAFPERKPGALTGQRWLEFLDHSAGGTRFSAGVGRVFAGAVYQAQPKIGSRELLRLCESWLHAIEPRLRQRGRRRC